MSTNQDEAVASFQAITGASADESRHFLAAYNYDLNAATSAFLDSEDGEVNNQGAFTQPTLAANVPQRQPQPVAAPAAKAPATQSRSKPPSRGGVSTLRDLSAQDERNDDDSDEEPQKYYAGGEKSGQMIQYPKSNKPEKRDTDEVVGEVFDSAKKHGAQVAEPPKPKAPTYFGGQGFTLGDSNAPSVPVQRPAAPQRQGPPEQNHTITFWRNGFSVDDGPLRKYEDPANKEFLDAINKGVVPQEMAVGALPGTRFGTNLVDNRQQEYVPPPKPKMVAFSGAGQALGSSSSTPAASTPAPAPTSAAPAKPPVVDESQPQTSIQIRLADGTRMVAKFNLTQTVADIRKFVEAARRGGPAYDLMTTFPQKVLSDTAQTIAEAGLQNAVIVQKPK